MGPENLNPLEELKTLDAQIDQVSDLAGLKPIFFRLDEIAKEHPNDFEVQLTAGDVKQHLVSRGTKLKQEPGAQSQVTPSAPPPVSPTFTGMASEAPPPPPPGPPPGPALSDIPSWGPPPKLSTGSMASRPPVAGGTSGTISTGQVPPPMPAPPPDAGRPGGASWKRALWLGALVGAVVAIGGITLLVNVARKRNASPGGGSGTAVAVNIATNPPGASVRINGQAMCTSNCELKLEPGNYQVTAFLNGYEPAASGVTLSAGKGTAVSLTLEPQSQTVRVLTDLDQGKIAMDGQPPADLQEGQFLFEKVQPGAHTIKVTGRNGEATVPFELATANIPAVTGPITVRNLLGVAVASFATQARVVTSSGPLKLSVNGQPESDAGPGGIDLRNYQPGVLELLVGEGKDQRNMKESFSPSPMLTVFLKSDQNIGTLIVSTKENDVRVFINNREYPRRTARGELRLQTIGNVTVRVAKDGFDASAPQTAEVKKGGEVRLEFAMKPAAQFAYLLISGGTPGADVLLDQKPVGAIDLNGAFSHSSVLPGNHVVEIRREQFITKRHEREFKAGQMVTLSGSDVVLASALPPAAPPPPPKAKAPESAPPPAPKPVVPPPPKVGTIADFEDPGAWRESEGIWLHRGAAFLAYKGSPKGLFSFTVHLVRGGNIFRGGRVRWAVNYTDSKNYALFELDEKNFWVKDVVKGKTTDRTKVEHNQNQKSWAIQVDVAPGHIEHKIQINGQWVNLDSWMTEAGRDFTQGKFGFLVQGNDEVGVSDFKFMPAR